MFLSKSCEKQFNIKNGTIKLGTLYSYREIENAELRDEHEGKLEFHLNFEGTFEVPKAWFTMVTGGAISFEGQKPTMFLGRQTARFATMSIASMSSSNVTLQNSRLLISREAPNCFVFCMSRVERAADCLGIFAGYDDYWCLKETAAREVGQELSKALLKHIRDEHSDGRYIVHPETSLDELAIRLEHKVVEYLPREVNLYHGGPMTLERFMERMDNMAFTKPDHFNSEVEYRFIFQVICQGEVVEPIVDSILLDSTSLLGLVF